MKIVVLVKQVPDTWSDRKLSTSTGWVDRAASDAVVDEIDERALEIALQYKDTQDAEVVAMTMAPQAATDVLRKFLATGADSAVHIVDPGLAGADTIRTATVLAAAIRRGGFDLVIAGSESTDGRGGVVPAMIAELLGRAHLTALDTVVLDNTQVSGERVTGDGVMAAHAALPAVVSVTERAAEPRFPNFKGILRAKKKPLETLTLADLGLDGAPADSGTVIVSVAERPARAAGVIVTDDGTAAAQLVDFLADAHLI